MPPFGPIKRRELVRYLRQLGFEGPFSGGNHQYVRHPDGRRVILPNPHQGDISRSLLSGILKRAGISRDEWETL